MPLVGSNKAPLYIEPLIGTIILATGGREKEDGPALFELGDSATVGNPGFKQYRYHVTWKGDTVVRMTPIGNVARTGFSDFDGKQVEVFYGVEGPGPLYQRDYMLKDVEPQPSPLHMDNGLLTSGIFGNKNGPG